MKQLIAILMIAMITLSSCKAPLNGDEAIKTDHQELAGAMPDEYIENEQKDKESDPQEEQSSEEEESKEEKQEELPNEEPSKEETQEEPEKETVAEAPIEEQEELNASAKESNDMQSNENLLDSLPENWEVQGVSLYKDTVYYHAYEVNTDYADHQYVNGKCHMYRMKLGKNQKPEYMGIGIIYGVYGSLLLGGQDGKYCLMDLSQKNPQWTALSTELWGNPQFHYKDRLWSFRKKNGKPTAMVIDLGKRSGKVVETAVYPQDGVIDGDLFYYVVESGKENIIYQADLLTKKTKELYRLSGEQKWQYAGGRVLIYEEHKNPLVIDVETMEQFVPMDFTPNFDEIGPHIMYENPGDGTIVAEYYNKNLKKCSYWYYNIATNKGGETEGFYSDRQSFGGGYYLFSECSEKTIIFHYNGAQYEFDAKSLGEKKVDAVNGYGAAVGGEGYIYTLRWSEGNAYSAVATEDHMVSLK